MPSPPFGVKEIRGVTSMVGTACLWCRADMDSDLAYDLTRWFDVSYNLYRDKGNKLATYTREAFRWTLDVAMAPVHDGTIRYFKEIGLWTANDDARQEYNLKLMTWYCEAWDAAIATAEKKNIEISDKNEDWSQLWTDHKKNIDIPPIRQMTDDEIRKGLKHLKSLGR
jgi:hypothetical protein